MGEILTLRMYALRLEESEMSMYKRITYMNFQFKSRRPIELLPPTKTVSIRLGDVLFG